MAKEPEDQLNIELSEAVADGVYANLAMISHSPSEFVIDFISALPGMPKARVKSRVIISPEHAKRLLVALKENVDKYEANFGNINKTEASFSTHVNFGGNIGEA